MDVAAACLLILTGCSVALGGQVVHTLGGPLSVFSDAPDPVDARPLPPPILPSPPSIPIPLSPAAVESDASQERSASALKPATTQPGLTAIPAFIAADRVDLRPCPGHAARCGPTATLNFNDEVAVLRLDEDDWAFVRVLRLNQDGYVLRARLAPTRLTRPEGRSTVVPQPDRTQDRSRGDPPATGEEKPRRRPREELVK